MNDNQLELEEVMEFVDENEASYYNTARPKRAQMNVAEKVYYEKWCKQNKRYPAVNSGYTILEHILSGEDGRVRSVSARDKYVASSVIQWLGTNCGMAFITEAERDIKEQQKVQSRLERLKENAKPYGVPKPVYLNARLLVEG